MNVTWDVLNNGSAPADFMYLYINQPYPYGSAIYYNAYPDSPVITDPSSGNFDVISYIVWGPSNLGAGEVATYSAVFEFVVGAAGLNESIVFNAYAYNYDDSVIITDAPVSDGFNVTAEPCVRNFTLDTGESCSAITKIFPKLTANAIMAINPGLHCNISVEEDTKVCIAVEGQDLLMSCMGAWTVDVVDRTCEYY